MAGSVNKVLIGQLGADPEIKADSGRGADRQSAYRYVRYLARQGDPVSARKRPSGIAW